MSTLKTRHPERGLGKEPNKPVKDINLLMQHLSTECNKSLTQKRKSLNFIKDQENQCFLLLKGSVALYRSSDSIILNSENAPFIFGLGNQVGVSQHLYLRTQEDSLIGMLSFTDARQIIRTHNLWESYANLLIYNASKIYAHCLSISQLSSYEIIKNQLVQLDGEPPSIKQNITAANYILSRTFLSRSGVMRILSRLKADGHITAERGILLTINHLPDKY
ncbi:helix-turn-helix domain-containing protein [Siccibacter colletis]|uniref:Helix-turn-helix domain-containing protein n=1 Tax=Siccibacter colletis TaxID=1505757 RepID=A0ABY6J9I8_9ENTR|nr:helix-turn-helix domain-containing protein [Siccibacter colletis]UYU30502.1 helix-turn-helix domain-containing protein [Siccibacter colletis]